MAKMVLKTIKLNDIVCFRMKARQTSVTVSDIRQQQYLYMKTNYSVGVCLIACLFIMDTS